MYCVRVMNICNLYYIWFLVLNPRPRSQDATVPTVMPSPPWPSYTFRLFCEKNSTLYPDSFVRGIKTHFMWPTAPSNCLHFFSFWQNFKILMNFSPLLWTLRSSVCQHICMPSTSAKTQWMTKCWTAPSLKFRSSCFLVEPLSAFIGGILNY